ncbi:hypothetical protein ZWY2020_047874 [Hordeum vulgare]|nr:hypothetical protein ZWY2020_047874 [Hordeum vulgare]
MPVGHLPSVFGSNSHHPVTIPMRSQLRGLPTRAFLVPKTAAPVATFDEPNPITRRLRLRLRRRLDHAATGAAACLGFGHDAEAEHWPRRRERSRCCRSRWLRSCRGRRVCGAPSRRTSWRGCVGRRPARGRAEARGRRRQRAAGPRGQEMAGACGDISCAVARLSGRCADPLLRRFDELYAGLVPGGAAPTPTGCATRPPRRWTARRVRSQRLVAATRLLCQEIDVLAELRQGARLRRAQFARPANRAPRREGKGREVDRLRAASLWNRSLDYAVRLLARSLFTIVARDHRCVRPAAQENRHERLLDGVARRCAALVLLEQLVRRGVRIRWYIHGFPVDARKRSTGAANSGKAPNGDVRRFLLSRSKSFRQLKWPVRSKHLIGCVVSGSKSPTRRVGPRQP